MVNIIPAAVSLIAVFRSRFSMIRKHRNDSAILEYAELMPTILSREISCLRRSASSGSTYIKNTRSGFGIHSQYAAVTIQFGKFIAERR